MRTRKDTTLLLAALLLASVPVHGSDHRDAPNIGEDATVDLTDLFAFRSPSDPSRTVLALAVNPFTVPGVTAFFSPYCIYQLAVDNNGDHVEDLVLQVTFRGTGREQTVEIRGPARPRRTGPRPKLLASAPALAGPTNETLEGSEMRLYAGLRDDPFFFDQQAFFLAPELRDPGIDFYAGKNVSAIVVEVPTRALLEKGKELRVWAIGARRIGDGYFQQDRVGRPAINVVLVPPGLRDSYNLTAPADDPRLYGTAVRQSLESLAIADAAVRDALGQFLLPDVLSYDPAQEAAFPNGRRPEDDVIDTVLGLLAGKGAAVPHDAKGKPTDHVGTNDVPFLRTFPFLAPPHAAR